MSVRMATPAARAPRRLPGAPRKAMILAAGYGARMGSLRYDLPKALMPLWNRSLLARNVDLLRSWGVRDILINAHHGAAALMHEAQALSNDAGTVTVSFEPDILGTGGALRRARWFFDERPFWLINADVVARLDPRPLLRGLRDPNTLAALWMHPDRGPRTVTLEGGEVVDFSCQQPGAPGTFTFCGLHLIQPDLLRYLPAAGFASIITVYQHALRDGFTIAGAPVPDAYWTDAGTPAAYLQAHRETAPFFAPAGARADVCVAPSARVAPDAVLKNCVIWNGATVAPGTCVSDAVIARNVSVKGRVSGVAVPARIGLSAAEARAFSTHVARRKEIRLSSRATLVWLPARGSDRTYARVREGRHRAILMRYDPARRENTLYVRHARFLRKQGWPVPAVFWNDPAGNRALLEDAGQRSLFDLVRTCRAFPLGRYRKVIDSLLHLHGPVTEAFQRVRVPTMPAFGPSVYRYERNLFIEHFLSGALGLGRSEIAPIRRDLLAVAQRVDAVRPVLLHRDLQSTNIYFPSREPVFIDFQGMRPGPAAYDLASLLCDPYVALSVRLRERLLADYAQRASSATFTVEEYRWACVQRLCQAIGAYARLSAVPGCSHFCQHIPVARALLQESLAHLPGLHALKRIS